MGIAYEEKKPHIMFFHFSNFMSVNISVREWEWDYWIRSCQNLHIFLLTSLTLWYIICCLKFYHINSNTYFDHCARVLYNLWLGPDVTNRSTTTFYYFFRVCLLFLRLIFFELMTNAILKSKFFPYFF